MPEDFSANPAFTEICPECRGKLMFGWSNANDVAVYLCKPCNLKVRQSREAGIIQVSPIGTLKPMEAPHE